MIQHIALVYAADDTLTSTEKHLLGAYCNHTDAHGYCWPGIERLCEETNLSRATVKRASAGLREKGLIKSVRRVNPRTKEPITNLTRVNVALLESLRRPPRTYNDNLVEAITFDEGSRGKDESPAQQARAHVEPYLGLNVSPTQAHSEPYHGLNVSPKTSQETSEKPSSPPVPPTRQRSGRRGAGRGEDKSSTEDLKRAERIVDDAMRCWDSTHRALNARDRRRLAARVVAELEDGGTERVILDELTRDMGSANRLDKVVFARTAEPGWGRSVDPRPDRSKYEITGPRPPWCGRCDERTRHVVVRSASGGERMDRCGCHPERVQDQEDAFGGSSDSEVPEPPSLEDLSADLESPSPAPAPRPSGGPDPSRVDLEDLKASFATAAAKYQE